MKKKWAAPGRSFMKIPLGFSQGVEDYNSLMLIVIF